LNDFRKAINLLQIAKAQLILWPMAGHNEPLHQNTSLKDTVEQRFAQDLAPITKTDLAFLNLIPIQAASGLWNALEDWALAEYHKLDEKDKSIKGLAHGIDLLNLDSCDNPEQYKEKAPERLVTLQNAIKSTLAKTKAYKRVTVEHELRVPEQSFEAKHFFYRWRVWSYVFPYQVNGATPPFTAQPVTEGAHDEFRWLKAALDNTYLELEGKPGSRRYPKKQEEFCLYSPD